MKFYFHHVGSIGANRDFPKTVFNDVSISVIEGTNFESEIQKQELVRELKSTFPSGKFNCWGVPSGARNIITNLKQGDCALLVESAHATGRIPALCLIELYQPIEYRELSNVLWGESKFPYIFFFNTIKLDFEWILLLDDIGYKQNFDPRGKFYSIASTRLEKYGNEEGYLRHLIKNYSANLDENYDSFALHESNHSYSESVLEYEEEYQESIDRIKLPSKIIIIDQPLKKPDQVEKNNIRLWKKDPTKGKSSIMQAGYVCEIDRMHDTFISKASGNKYLEAHHLIPMQFQEEFDNSLDVEGNIISLCPNCHKKIHLSIGEQKKEMISKLFNLRKERLLKCGLQITQAEVLSMYNI